MRTLMVGLVMVSVLTVLGAAGPRSGALYPAVKSYLEARGSESIPAERREVLDELAGWVREQHAASGEAVRLVFVCTHNSRRSQMSQVWARAAALKHGMNVETYSGGTETTAFNPRAVAALERAGVRVEPTTTTSNPVHHVRVGGSGPAMTCFSKVYDMAPNPAGSFAAVMVCDDADEKCPHVLGAEARFAVKYVDPKVSDGTARESATYDERCAQIAREMLYVFREAGAGG